jgi:hypothetical protein
MGVHVGSTVGVGVEGAWVGIVVAVGVQAAASSVKAITVWVTLASCCSFCLGSQNARAAISARMPSRIRPPIATAIKMNARFDDFASVWSSPS